MISNIVRKKIQLFDLQEASKEILLQRVQKMSFTLHKKQEILKICSLYIRDGGRYIESGQLILVEAIIKLVQQLLNEICLPDDNYDWVLLRVHYVCLRLRYLFVCPSSSKVKKSIFITRIRYFLKEMMANPYYRKLKEDYYSHLQICYFYAIKDALLHEKHKQTEILIEECFDLLKTQITILCYLLEFEDDKVFQLIKNKTQFFLKLYAIQLSKHKISSQPEKDIWKPYEQVLQQVPNIVDHSSMEEIVYKILCINQHSHMNNQSLILSSSSQQMHASKQKRRERMSFLLSPKNQTQKVSKNSIEPIQQLKPLKKQEKKSQSKNKKSGIFQIAIKECNQYQTKWKRSRSQDIKDEKFKKVKDSLVPALGQFLGQRSSFIMPKCMRQSKKLKL